MADSAVLALIHNAALLLSMVLVFEMLLRGGWERPRLPVQILVGAVLGLIGIAVMLTPWQPMPGILLDTRSVLLASAGLFFGAPATLTAMAATAALRVLEGGDGLWMGLGIILIAGATGLAWRRWIRARGRDLADISAGEAYLFGLTIHLLMLVLVLGLPHAVAAEVLARIALPVLAIFPAATLVLVLLMARHLRRRRDENLFAETQERLKYALEASRDGIWDWDLRRGTMRFSQSWSEMLGFDRTDIGDDPQEWLGRIHPENLPAVEAALNGLVTGRIPVLESEHRLRAGDGGWRWVLAHGVVVERDSGGTALRIVGTQTDISDRRAMESALRESNRRLSALMANLPGMAYRCRNGPEWTMDFVSEGCQALTGHPASELLGHSRLAFSQLIHPGDRERVWSEVQAGLAGTGRFELEYRLVLEGGSEKWVWERGAGIYGPGGELLALEGLILDNDARKRAEIALRENEAFLSTLIEAISVPVFYKDRDGHYLGCNNAFEGFFGASRERLIGKTVFDVSPPGLAETYREKDIELLSEPGKGQQYESRVRNAQGALRDVIFSKAAFFDGQGAVAGLIGTIYDITERKQIEDALRESEKRFRALFDHAGVGIAEIETATGRFLQVNQHYCELLGYDAEELAGLDFQGVTHPEDLQTDLEHMTRLVAGDIRGYSIEERYLRKDGTPLWAHLTITPLWAAGEAPSHHIAVAADISARKRAEAAARVAQARTEELLAKSDASRRVLLSILEDQRTAEEELRQSEARLREAQRVARIGSWQLDVATRKVGWSEEVFAIFELTPAQFDGTYEGFLALVHPDDREALDQAYRESVAGGEPYDLVHRIRLRDGRIKHLHERGETQFDAAGAPVRSIGTVQDVTERVQAEQALRRSELLFRSQFDLGNIGIAIASPETGWLRVNPYLCQLLGYSETELQSMTWTDITHPDDRAADQAQLERLLAGEIDAYEMDKRFSTRSGGTVHSHLSVACCREAGRLKLIIASVLDISARKRAEDEVRRLNADLEQRVRERTAELEAANRELEAFTYSVSHDLRAPLRAIRGFAQLLARHHRDALDEDGRRYLDNVVEAGDHMGTLIEDLLQYSRTGRGAVRTQAVQLKAVLEGHIARFGERITAAGARLELHEPLATPRGDATLIGQIFANLLDNALTYRRPEEPPRIQVSARLHDGHVQLCVADNGIGIAPEYRDKIFQVFQRLHGPDEYPGTGIGLAIVAKAVSLMDGTVTVESEVGAGSRFTVTLPAASGEGDRPREGG